MTSQTINPMREGHPFKLGLFCINADGALAITKVKNRWPADWDEISKAVRLADDAGLDFILPIARWRGYGGDTDVRGTSFETLTHAAAVAAITRRIAIFSTVHVPLVHPVFAAKALSTIDHVSHGRAGLNIVCGFYKEEFDMFGAAVKEHEKRYEQGYEWLDIIVRIFGGEGPFDYKGEFYDLKGVTGAPPPLQLPRPFTICAGTSPTGRRFAARTSDMMFTWMNTTEKAQEDIAVVRAEAAVAHREVGLMTGSYVVCRETDAEAEEYHRYYAEEMADVAAVDFHMSLKHTQTKADVYSVERRRYAAGSGLYPLVGSPETIAQRMVEMHRLGFDGTTISFVNFNDELPFFIERVLPLLEQAGLRLGTAKAA